MRGLASMLAMAGIWFCAVIFLGFMARAFFELASLGWNLWP